MDITKRKELLQNLGASDGDMNALTDYTANAFFPCDNADSDEFLENWKPLLLAAESDGIAAAINSHLVKEELQIIFESPETLHVELFPSIGGIIPIIATKSVADFESMVQYIIYKGKEVPNISEMGASFAFGKFNRFIILSNKPYSNVSAKRMELDEDLWREKSLIIRKYTFLIIGSMLSAFTGCSETQESNANDTTEPTISETTPEDTGYAPEGEQLQGLRFDYGIVVNIPDAWDPGAYNLTSLAEPNPNFWTADYPPHLFLHMEYRHLHEDESKNGGDPYPMFDLYVMDWVDWNDMMLSSAYGPYLGTDIRGAGDLAYVITNLPQDCPVDDEYSIEEFNRMMDDTGVYLTGESNGFIIIEQTDETPSKTKSSVDTVECGFAYMKLNIPTKWDYRFLEVNSDYESDFNGYEAVESVTYSIKALPGETFDLFTAYVFPNDVWNKIEANADGGPTGAVKITADAMYTLAVLLPQDNPMVSEEYGDISQRFDDMQQDIRDNLETFFGLY